MKPRAADTIAATTNVKDNHATGDTMTAGAESVDGGNTNGWFIGVAVPELPLVGLVVLAFFLGTGRCC